ncbi:MAG: hypothetical protein ACXVC6_13085 [Bacteroidia bacterium]
MISRFFVEPFLFPVNLDDCMYNALLNTFTFPELVQMLPGDCNGHLFSHFDGRMFSNMYSLLVFSIFKHHWASYYIYTLFLFLVLIGAFYFMYRSLMINNRITFISPLKSLLLSAYTACLIYIFVMDGRYEVFYWISSTSNHLLSLIFFILCIGLLSYPRNWLSNFLLCILCFCFGQMNEVYAFSYCCVFLFFAFIQPKKRMVFLLMIAFVSSAVMINLTSPGTISRFNVLYDISTHFNFVSSLIDTKDTFLIPFVNYRYLPIKTTAFVIFFLLIKDHFKIHFKPSSKKLIWFNRILLIVSVLSVFLHCYIMGEVCTYRGLLFLGLSFTYFVFIMAAKNIFNPLKLFLSF